MEKQIESDPPGRLFEQLGEEIVRLNVLLASGLDRLMEHLDLSRALWQVLRAVGSAPSPMAQIARDLKLTRQSVRRSANVLEDKGLVEFQDNPDHRRAKLVAMTEQGASVLEHAEKRQADWASDISKGLKSEDLTAALYVIRVVGDRQQRTMNSTRSRWEGL